MKISAIREQRKKWKTLCFAFALFVDARQFSSYRNQMSEGVEKNFRTFDDDEQEKISNGI